MVRFGLQNGSFTPIHFMAYPMVWRNANVDQENSALWAAQNSATSPRAATPCSPRRLAAAFALLLPAHRGLVSQVRAPLARAFLLRSNRVIVNDKRRVQFK